MYDIEYYKRIFDRYGGMMRTTQLAEEKVHYPQREKLIEEGYVEKVRRGYYQWVNPDDFSEAGTVAQLFPDAILCMDTATEPQQTGIWLSARILENPDSISTTPS